MRSRLATWGSSALRFLQIGTHPGHGFRSRIAAITQVEDEPRVAHRDPAEAGRRNVSLTQKFFLPLSANARVIPYSRMRLGYPFLPNAFPTCLTLLYLTYPPR